MIEQYDKEYYVELSNEQSTRALDNLKLVFCFVLFFCVFRVFFLKIYIYILQTYPVIFLSIGLQA
jgi:hypothetical protein